MMKCAIGNPKRGKDRESMFFPQEKSEFELKNTQENESRRLSAPVFGAYCLCSFHRCVLRGLGQETQGGRKRQQKLRKNYGSYEMSQQERYGED